MPARGSQRNVIGAAETVNSLVAGTVRYRFTASSGGEGQYKAVAEGDVITFETETVSPKDGRLVWKGTVKGDTIEGLFTHYRKPTWWRKNPAPIEHWLKGKLKQ